MLTPVLTSLAVVLPAVFGVSELITLSQQSYRPRRAKRAIRRRAMLLFVASGVAAVLAIYYWGN